MTRYVIASLAGTLLLAACGGSDTEPTVAAPKVAVDDLPTGSYLVSLGDEAAPTIGQYYSAADGSRLLIVNNPDEQASTLYKRSSNAAWQRIPAATSDVSISLLQSKAVDLTPADASSLSGHFTVPLQSGSVGFTLGADGKLSADAGSSCAINGSLGDALLPGVRKLSLNLTGCGALPASLQGIAVTDGDYAPARWRLVLDNGSQLSELWAYAE
ncbi:hypothetical protein [Chitinimonas naiadis]